MPSDLVLKAMNAVHHVVLTVTRGRVGWTAQEMPVLELTTVGRKSGQPRKVLLTAPHIEGDVIILVASRGGDDHHPAWFLNLRDSPDVQVRLQGAATQRMRARIADEAERERLWPIIVAKHSLYGGYQRRTAREIPVILLQPGPVPMTPG